MSPNDKKRGYIYFNGLSNEEFDLLVARFVRQELNEVASPFTILPAGSITIETEGWNTKVGNSFGQRYTNQVPKFPAFQDSWTKIIIPIAFDVHGLLPPNIYDHLALLYLNKESNLAQLFCAVADPLYRYAVKSYVMPRIRQKFPGMRYQWNRLSPKNSTKTFSYPDACTLLALWTLVKIVTLPAERLDSLHFPSLSQMHAFRMGLGLDQDKENNPPVGKRRRK